MKRQLRPYTVEIKSPRLRSSPGPLASGSALQGFNPFPADLPVRDVHEDLVAGTQDERSAKSGALREAERIFGGLKAAAVELSPVQSTVPSLPLIGAPDVLPRARASEAVASEPNGRAPEVRRPRILPDLREQARPQESSAVARPFQADHNKRSSTSPRKSRNRPTATGEELAPAISSPEPLAGASVDGERLLPFALASLVNSRLALAVSIEEREQPRRRLSQQLPRGERWKARRLPRVCWARPRWR